ncbi:TfoX/Sxy family protein [Blastococcus sp. SYSU D00820]
MPADPAPRRLRDLRNLGAASEAALARVGIRTPEDLDEVGAAEAYRRLADAGTPRLSTVFLWALEGALLDLDWRVLPAGRKAELRRAAGLPG